LNNTPQQPAQDIRAGDNFLFLAPEQDNIFIDDIIFSVLGVNLEAWNYVPKRSFIILNDDRTVAVTGKNSRLIHLVEEKRRKERLTF